MEDLETDDFIQSADSSLEVRISRSIVTDLKPDHAKGAAIATFAVGDSQTKVGHADMDFFM